MTFNDVYAQFIKSTKEKFPVDVCIKQNEKESNVNWNVYDINVICECGGNFAYMPKYESDDLQKGVIK